jgi:hypothetical protein
MKHADNLAGKAALVPARHVGEHLAHQVHCATLLPGLRQRLARGRT